MVASDDAEWPRINAYRITNRLGHLDQALAVARNPEGGTFPVGTIIQLVPFEAMVKRKAGFSPTTNDWEFCALDVDATGARVSARGTTKVVNQFGGVCFTCRAKADPKYDFVCGDGHGCDPLPISPRIV
ncbi:MAG: hypothetical protein ACI9WU_001056 [Myxococcota bacterium]